MLDVLKKVISGMMLVLLLASGIIFAEEAKAANFGSTGWMGELEYETDRNGNDIYKTTVVSEYDCRQMCRLDIECKAMTFNKENKFCYLKDPAPGTSDAKNGISSKKHYD
ncbi:MAG: hypothetical protein F6K21_32640 [Symploca sp. SIO2D2]|nr:hypothetical protein [Symploca sp. SIO2D2]